MGCRGLGLGQPRVLLGFEPVVLQQEADRARELEAVSTEMARLPPLTEETCAAILNEMSEVPLAAGTAVPGRRPLAQPELEQAQRVANATGTLGRVSRQHGPSATVQRQMEMEASYLFHLLREEHAPTIARVVSLLRADKACELLNLLRPEVRTEIIEILATLDPAPVEHVRRLENHGESESETGREPDAA